MDAFFAAAVANGATVRGGPGVWTQYSERYYAAFVNDLHQNNVEAVWHSPEPVVDAPRRPGVPLFVRSKVHSRTLAHARVTSLEATISIRGQRSLGVDLGSRGRGRASRANLPARSAG